jgi:hypothetical protein
LEIIGLKPTSTKTTCTGTLSCLYEWMAFVELAQIPAETWESLCLEVVSIYPVTGFLKSARKIKIDR